MSINQENLMLLEEAEEKINDEQENLFSIYSDIEPILSFYIDKSKIKQGKNVYPTLTFDDPINTIQYLNGWAPKQIDRKILEAIIKKAKIHIKSLMEEQNEKPMKTVNTTFNNTINNIVGDANNINFGVLYGNAISKIEKSNLSDAEKDEIINQVELIKMILESNEAKEKKWSKIKNIGKWIFDKSLEVGITLLPLIVNGFNGK